MEIEQSKQSKQSIPNFQDHQPGKLEVGLCNNLKFSCQTTVAAVIQLFVALFCVNIVVLINNTQHIVLNSSLDLILILECF